MTKVDESRSFRNASMSSAFQYRLETVVLVARSSTLAPKKNSDTTNKCSEMAGGSMATETGVELCVMTTSNVYPARWVGPMTCYTKSAEARRFKKLIVDGAD